MITITRTADELRVEGHAHTGKGPANEREKLACAGVTALVHQLIACLDEMTDGANYSFERGRFILRAADHEKDLSSFLVKSFLLGAERMRIAYGDLISVIDKDQAWKS